MAPAAGGASPSSRNASQDYGSRDHSRRISTSSELSDGAGSNTGHPIRPPVLGAMFEKPHRLAGDGSLVMWVTCFFSLAVFLFGYDQGVMSGIITNPYFKDFFENPTAFEIGTMVAILEIGAFFTSLACGTLADIFGRKKVLLAGALVFSIGGAIQTFTQGFYSMVIGRTIAGFGVGFLSMIAPTFQSEVSPAENRGKLACIEFTGNIVGYAFSVWVGYFSSFISGHAAWRFPLSLQVIVGLFLAFGSFFLPESPRWLLDQGRDEEGMRVLADLHGRGDPRDARARLEYREIKENVIFMRQQGSRSYTAMWSRYRRRTLIACSVLIGAQFNGINVVSYYAPLVFESAGWVGRDAILMTGINGIIYVLSTIPTWFLIDKWGRRFILMSGAIMCAIALNLCGYFLWLDSSYTPQAVVGCIIVFNAFFGYSWGPVGWLYPAEIMPLAFRAKGTSLATAMNWAATFIVGESTPILQEQIKWRLYPMFGFFCLCSCAVCYFFYPETMGVPLEEVDTLFNDSTSGVPQGDDTDDEEEADARQPRPIRRSISSHPRFEGEEEQAARKAAARVAAEEREAAQKFFGVVPKPGWVKRLFGDDTPDRAAYQPVSGTEH